MRRFVFVVALLAALAGPTPAQAKSFTLPEATINARVLPDGSVRVTEHITYAFSGAFSGGYREIPHLREDLHGDTHRLSVDDIGVSENGRGYRPGASAELGSSGDPDTFGVAELGDRTRIVWHYSASNETRTFEVHYTLRDLAVAHDDVVDVNLRVWGDEWEQELNVLNATMTWPGAAPGETLVWGHPEDVSGVTSLKRNGKGATLTPATCRRDDGWRCVRFSRGNCSTAPPGPKRSQEMALPASSEKKTSWRVEPPRSGAASSN